MAGLQRRGSISPSSRATPWRKLFARTGAWLPARVRRPTIRRSELPLAFADGTRADAVFRPRRDPRAAGAAPPISEIEVELERGDPLRLFELATALAADLPRTQSLRASKAERGYALAGDARAQAAAGARRRADGDGDPAGGARRRSPSNASAQVEVNAEGMLAHDDAEYLHQLRVGWRRLRSLLKLVGADRTIRGSRCPRSGAPLARLEPRTGARLGRIRGGDAARRRRRIPRAARHRPSARARHAAPAPAGGRRPRGHCHAAIPAAAARTRRFFCDARPDTRKCAAAGAGAGLDRSGAAKAARQTVAPGAAHPSRRCRRSASRARRGEETALRRRVLRASVYPQTPRAPTSLRCPSCNPILGRLNDLEIARKLLDEIAPAEDALPGAAYASGIVRGWLAASVAPQLKRLRSARAEFAKGTPFWTA